jgi:uncharacterized membrane protein
MKMKRYLSIAAVVMALYSCESHTYEELEETTVIVDKVTYNANVKPIIDANCISCHSENGSFPYRKLLTYSQVRDAVETSVLLERIQLQNGEDGIMPQTGRMPQDKINIILKWKEDGLLEN